MPENGTGQGFCFIHNELFLLVPGQQTYHIETHYPSRCLQKMWNKLRSPLSCS